MNALWECHSPALVRRYVSSTLVCMSTPEHVKRNLEPLQFENDPSLLKELKAIIAPVHNRVWPSGRVENDR